MAFEIKDSTENQAAINCKHGACWFAETCQGWSTGCNWQYVQAIQLKKGNRKVEAQEG